MGVSLFLLDYLSGSNSVDLSNIEQRELFSWSETVKEDNKLLLKIEGRIKGSEKDVVDTICVLSVVNGRYFFIHDKGAEERKRENSCQYKSKVNPQNNGNWKFENTFRDRNYRIIRVEKIYKQHKVSGSKSYIDFTVGRNYNGLH